MARLKPDLRKEVILTAAVLICTMPGNSYLTITREEVGKAACVAPSLINTYFGTMDELRDEIIKKAITLKRLPILAQAMANQHESVKSMDAHLKHAVLTWMKKTNASTGSL